MLANEWKKNAISVMDKIEATQPTYGRGWQKPAVGATKRTVCPTCPYAVLFLTCR